MRSQTHFGFIPCWVYDSLGSPRDFYNALIPNLFLGFPELGIKTRSERRASGGETCDEIGFHE